MTSANVELVRSIYADWERGDYGSADWADPEIEFGIVGGLEPGTWHGVTGMAEAWANVLKAWEVLRAEAEEYRELDHERVLVLMHNTGRGRTSGVDVEEMRTRMANIFHIRDGKVAKLVLYWNRADALTDLGLAKEAEDATAAE